MTARAEQEDETMFTADPRSTALSITCAAADVMRYAPHTAATYKIAAHAVAIAGHALTSADDADDTRHELDRVETQARAVLARCDDDISTGAARAIDRLVTLLRFALDERPRAMVDEPATQADR